jgi:hypothetical protein
LQQPELYDIEQDPAEAYDAAPENPAVVAEITGRIERLIAGFPEEVKQAWCQTRARQTAARAVGALPAPAPAE